MPYSDIDQKDPQVLRTKALKWWKALPKHTKAVAIIVNKEYIVGYPDRNIETLTGREIEIIYKNSEDEREPGCN